MNEKAQKDYFTRNQWIIFAVVVAAGLVLRWLLLDERPLHHDESLHVVYGKYYYNNPTSEHAGYYQYHPMLHGPLLYIVLFFSYNILGVSEWAARAPVALIGSLGVFLPLIFRRFFSPLACLALTAAVAFSPTLIYWCRFIREDNFVVFGIFCVVFGVLQARVTYKAIWIGLGLAIQAASKESWYVHIALVLGYLIFEAFINYLRNLEINTGFQRVTRYLKDYAIQTAFGVAVAVFLFCILYSAGFQYPKGILDGLYRESIKYWWDQHGQERIKGPFLFNVFTLAWYESIFVVGVLVSLWQFYKKAPLFAQISFGITALITILLYTGFRGVPEHEFVKNQIFHFFKAKSALDIFGIILIPIHAVICTLVHLLRREQTLSAAGYFFWGGLFTYSYLGEKVPWLTIYPLIGGLIYLALFFDNYYQKYPITNWRSYSLGEILFRSGAVILSLWIIFCIQEISISQNKNILFAILISGAVLTIAGILELALKKLEGINLASFLFVTLSLYSLYSTSLTNFVYAGEANEFLSQVHTTREIRDIAVDIRKEVISESRGYRPRIYVDGDPVWPLTWYFRDLPEYKFQATASDQEKNTFKYQFLTWDEKKVTPDGYRNRRINLRGWWVPDYQQLTLRNFIWYALTHKPWSTVGYSYATFYTRIGEE